MDVLTVYMMVLQQFSLCITVPSNLQLILTTHQQFKEYFEIIESTKGKAKFNKILEVRVGEKDKKKILEARNKEKEKQGKPPQCIKEVVVDPQPDQPKGKKMKPEKVNVFDEYMYMYIVHIVHVNLYIRRKI